MEQFEFSWDRGNKDKNWKKHRVSTSEAEEAYQNENSILTDDIAHSAKEKRYILIGSTQKERLLYIVFTKRGNKNSDYFSS